MSAMKMVAIGQWRWTLTLSDALGTVLSTEQWKWFQPKMKVEGPSPRPRAGHALVAIRDRVFLFGGLTEIGLSSELWILDLDSLTWSEVPTFGAVPCARKGAALVATENGRRMFLFGGSNGVKTFNDVHVLDIDHFSWSLMGMIGDAPAGREGAAISCISPYILISGGSTTGECGSRRLVTDSWALHVQRCGQLECLEMFAV
jgi:hypothetical protein